MHALNQHKFMIHKLFPRNIGATFPPLSVQHSHRLRCNVPTYGYKLSLKYPQILKSYAQNTPFNGKQCNIPTYENPALRVDNVPKTANTPFGATFPPRNFTC